MIFFIKKVYQIIKLFFFKIKYNFFISKNRKKKFKNDFLYFLSKIKSGKNFGFSRFSDGELFIIQNKKLIIDGENESLKKITETIYEKFF